MIITEIYKGQGLGNQLWTYVVTRVIAKDKGVKFGIKSPEKLKCHQFMHLDLGEQVYGGSGPEGGPPTSLPKGIENYYLEKKIVHPNGADISVYDKDLVAVADNTKLEGNMQDEQYILHRRDEIRQWLAVDANEESNDFADDSICVINFRGGEYARRKDVFLPMQYWTDAIKQMRTINPNFRFVVITEDVRTAKKFFPHLEVYHFSVGKDYVSIKNAHYLILSNSSFAWFPAWLNTNLKFCIAPKYWWGYNDSDGYWACGYNITSGWHYLNKRGELEDYDSCLADFQNYTATHPELYGKTA